MTRALSGVLARGALCPETVVLGALWRVNNWLVDLTWPLVGLTRPFSDLVDQQLWMGGDRT